MTLLAAPTENNLIFQLFSFFVQRTIYLHNNMGVIPSNYQKVNSFFFKTKKKNNCVIIAFKTTYPTFYLNQHYADQDFRLLIFSVPL